MLPINRNKPVIGDCEVCDTKNTEVYKEHGNILMCASCKNEESRLSQKSRDAKKLIEESRAIDNSIQIQPDIYNAKTVAAIELRGAIENDETIPADKKEEAFTRECLTRRNHFQKVLFEKRNELKELENEMQMWQVNGQQSAAKLSAKVREEFKSLDVQYQPIKQSKVSIKKATVVKAPQQSGKVKAKEAREMAAKYKIDATAILMVASRRGISIENAAKFLSEN